MVKDYSTLVQKAYQDAGKYAASPQQNSRGNSKLGGINSSYDQVQSRSATKLEPSRNGNVASSYAYG